MKSSSRRPEAPSKRFESLNQQLSMHTRAASTAGVGYAYETIANQPITAGKTKGLDVALEPASLGHLAQGASTISAWRNKTGDIR